MTATVQKPIRGLIATMLASVLLVTLACGGGADPTQTPAPTPTTIPTTTPTATPAATSVPTPTTDYSSITGELSQLIQSVVDESGITGLSVALVDDQEMVWAEGFGFAD